MRLYAWANLDSFSTACVTGWPQFNCYLTNDDFLKVSPRYLGLPSPACETLAGPANVGPWIVMDAFSLRLHFLATAGASNTTTSTGV